MPQNRLCDVTPTSDQDKYSLALQDQAGLWYGLDVPFSQIFVKTNNAQAPLQRVGMNSFHAGRGFDRYTPEQYGLYDSRNGWSTTPGKYHATLLMKWGRGLRDAVSSMPDANGVTFKPLVGSTKCLDVTFVPSANFTAAKLILIIRRKVPAGAAGVPGTLTAEICADSGGFPSTVLETATLTSSTLTDVTSEYYVWTISEALTSGTTYHLKVYGASGDRAEACWEIGCDPSAAGLRNAADSSWSTNSVATAYSPYYRITDADIACTYKPFIWDGVLYLIRIYDNLSTSSRLFLNGVRGRAVGTQSSTTLKDTGHGSYGATNWTTNRFANCYVRIIRGTGQGQVRLISSNDADTLTVSTAWDVTPVTADSEYMVFGCDWFVELGTTGLGVVTGEPAVQNGIVYFPQNDTVNIRIMQMDYTDADDHAFDVESTNNNKGYFLSEGYDPVLFSGLWRANNAAATGTPNSPKVSVAFAPTSPLGTPVTFGTDVLFGTSIPCGDNTNRITGINMHADILHVRKEDGLFVIQNNQAARIRIGVETAPDITNGRAAVTAADKNLYIGFQNDMFLITGSGAYPTRLNNNLPSNRSGYVADLEAAKGWIFAAVDAGASGYSSVMKFSLDTASWSEQIRGFFLGRRITSVQWQNPPDTDARPRLWWGIAGEMMFQEFPLNGVRPLDDTSIKYQHETEIILPTIDLYTTDPKYFATLTINTKGLAQEGDTEAGHEIVVEYQADNDIGGSTWYFIGSIKRGPTGSVRIQRGNKRALRLRLRPISSEATDPVVIESISSTLFSRNQLANSWTVYFKVSGDDDEQNGQELLNWLRAQAQIADELTLFSKFRLYHQRKVTISDEPRYKIEEVDPDEDEIEATMSLVLTEVV